MISRSLREQLHIYVVNLDRRTDRRAWMAQQLPDELRVTYAPDAGLACDGTLLSKQEIDELSVFPWYVEPGSELAARDPSYWKWWSTPMTVGDIGCALSHLNCWNHALRRGAPLTLVFEDDAMLRKNFWSDLESALADLDARNEDWQLLYCYHWPLIEDLTRISPRIVLPGYSYHATGYLLTLDGLRGVTSAGLADALVTVDEFLPAMYIDHPREDMRARFPKRLRALAFDPPIVLPLVRLFGSDSQNAPILDDA